VVPARALTRTTGMADLLLDVGGLPALGRRGGIPTRSTRPCAVRVSTNAEGFGLGSGHAG